MINQCTIEGRLGKDPEVKSFGNGSIVKFSIAHREAWKDKASGEWREKISWFNVESKFNVDRLASEIRKGDLIVCTGKVVVESWTNPDTDQKTNFVKFVATTVSKIAPRSTGESKDDTPF